MIRQGFGNNNVDTCARVCHSPTGYGLKHHLRHFGRHAGFRQREFSDVILVIGANPTDGHPVFASRMKQRLRQGRQADRRSIRAAPIWSVGRISRPAPSAAPPGHQCRGADRDGARHRDRGPRDEDSSASAATGTNIRTGQTFVSEAQEVARSGRGVDRRAPEEIRAAARLFATGGNGAIYYGLGVTEHSQGSSTVMAIANLAMAPAMSAARASA
jgi:formate dehydrogenase major subunit